MSTGSLVTVEVPDIGDFEEVPIIEILVSPGDQVALDDPLITLESDKATMDVPAPFAGVVRELQVQVGDRVSQGTPLLTIEPASDGGSGSDATSKASAVVSDGAPTEAAAPDSVAGALAASWARQQILSEIRVHCANRLLNAASLTQLFSIHLLP